MRYLIYLTSLIGLLALLTFAGFSDITTYRSTIQANDVVFTKGHIWVATPGGLACINQEDYSSKVFYNIDDYHDIFITALVVDSAATIWAGTKSGYLYSVAVDGTQKSYPFFSSKKWEIRDLYVYGRYLCVAFREGFTIIDIDDNLETRQTVLSLGAFINRQVNDIIVHNDTLYLASPEGVAYTYLPLSSVLSANLIDPNAWSTIVTPNPIRSFLLYNGAIKFLDGHGVTIVHDNIILDTIYKISNAIDSGNIDTIISDTIYDDVAILFVNDSVLYINSVNESNFIKSFDSPVTFLQRENDSIYWVGTKENYLYRCSAKKILRNVKIPHLANSLLYKATVANDGTVWFTPKLPSKPEWFNGIVAFKDDHWLLYNTRSAGALGQEGEMSGLCDGKDGTIWFGTYGSQVKRYNTANNTWTQYDVVPQFAKISTGKALSWGRCRAIARDSLGYMWFTYRSGYAGFITCYDPSKGNPDSTNHRKFFPKKCGVWQKDPTFFNVDKTNRFFIGSDDDGKDESNLLVFRYTIDPLTDTGLVVLYDTTIGFINDMVTDAHNRTWVSSPNGLFCFYDSPEKGLVLTKVSDVPNGVTCLEWISSVENTTIMYMGTNSNGLCKAVICDVFNEVGEIVSIKVDNFSQYTPNDGLVDWNITDLAIDRKRNVLWAVSSNGVSRINITNEESVLTSNKDIFAYPNPFVKSHHKQIFFEHIMPGAGINVYTIDGRLVAHIFDEGSNVVKNKYEWKYLWRPNSNIVPGTYFFTGRERTTSKNNSDKSIVGKLLILP